MGASLDKSDAKTLWRRFGLASPRFGKTQASSQFSTRQIRFRQALQEAGGLFSSFGCFLSLRADLLDGSYLQELLKIGPPEVCHAPETTFPESFKNPVALTQGACSRIYQTSLDTTPVIVETFGDATKVTDGAAWETFLAGVGTELDGPENGAMSPRVIEEFRCWLELHGNIEKKRRILSRLRHLPGSCVTRFPVLIPQLQGERMLVYSDIGGEPVKISREQPDSTVLRQLLESVLEQSMLLSVIAADLQPGHMVRTKDGGIGYRLCPAIETVPPTKSPELLQYFASVIQGERKRALNLLARLLDTGNVARCEKGLSSEYDSDLSARREGSPPVSSFVRLHRTWRALSASEYSAPLFVNLFHRNLAALGGLSARSPESTDPLAESLWPVLGRLIHVQMLHESWNTRTRQSLMAMELAVPAMKERFICSGEGVTEAEPPFLSESLPAVSRPKPSLVATLGPPSVLALMFLLSVRMSLVSEGAVAEAAFCFLALVCLFLSHFLMRKLD